MDLIKPDYFIHAANVLLLLAYLVRDMLWLRLLALGSSPCAIPYFILHPAALWAPLLWSAVFAAVNLFQAWCVYTERRPVKLTPEEEEVRRLAFEDLPPKKVLQVLSLGSWGTVNPGERLLESGKRPDILSCPWNRTFEEKWKRGHGPGRRKLGRFGAAVERCTSRPRCLCCRTCSHDLLANRHA
jgi:hypothetical protein